MGFMMLFWVLVVAAIGLIAWYALTQGQKRTRTAAGPEHPDALEILKERYARGEIGREEFEQKKRDISE